ncbi:DNA polymerase III subunit beta [Atopococcus tabaci]|uniref:DNA polymerase III subunit beta n=1 Tax=Atopococcus tabaci TaxID=269774 RepID=UPI00040AA6A7|nr:DNA polymerase III subunit beta [Atopococcus tabaci]
MKFTIKRSAFLKSMADVQLAISSRTTIPILTGIKLTADPDGLTLTGSDADISIETYLSAEDEDNELTIEQTGAIVLQPARFFSDIVKKLPDENFSLEVLDQFQVAITSASSSFTINGLDANHYPRLPEIDAQDRFMLPVRLFKQVIKQTVIAVSTHESRPILTGVQMTIQDSQLKAVATDSHRLSRRVIPLDVEKDKHYNIVIPGKSLTELSRLLDDDLENLEMIITENQVLFKTKETSFYTRLLEGNYPDTDRLIPSNTATQVTLDANVLLGAVERASLLSHEGKNNVVKLTVEPDFIQISGNSPEVGKVEEEVAFNNIEGEPIQIAFNPDYMKAALNAYGPMEISIQLVTSLRPFILVPADDSRDFIQLITPIRTPD